MAITEMRPAVIAVRPRGQRGLPGAPGAPGDQSNFQSRIAAAATSIDVAVVALRTLGYAVAGDGGDAIYKRVSTSPSLGGFQSADGAYWEYVVSGPINIVQFGGLPDDSTPCDDAFAAAWDYLNSFGSGCIYFPAGVYRFLAAINETLPASTGCVKIMGDGPKITQLHFPNATSGLIIHQGDYRSNIVLDGFSVTTGQPGTNGNGILLTGPYVAVGTTSWSYVVNVMCHGDDYGTAGGYQNYWAVAIKAHVWSQFTFINVNTYGKIGPGGGGTGVIFEGDASTSQYGILYNFQQCSFNYHQIGALYGDWIQGVTFNQCNFNGGSGGTAIFSGGGYTGLLSQLAVTNCQFDYKAACIQMNTGCYDVQLSNNIFSVSASNAIAVSLPQAVHFNITGNKFFNYDAVNFTGTFGLNIAGTGTVGTVIGNSFVGFGIGIAIQSGVTNIVVALNPALSTSIPISDASGSSTNLIMSNAAGSLNIATSNLTTTGEVTAGTIGLKAHHHTAQGATAATTASQA